MRESNNDSVVALERVLDDSQLLIVIGAIRSLVEAKVEPTQGTMISEVIKVCAASPQYGEFDITGRLVT